MKKEFFAVSRLNERSREVSGLRQFATEDEAVEVAKMLVAKSAREHNFEAFYVLKVIPVSKVDLTTPPMTVTKIEATNEQ